MNIVRWIIYWYIIITLEDSTLSHLRTPKLAKKKTQNAQNTLSVVAMKWHTILNQINTPVLAVLRHWTPLSVAALLMVAAGIHRLRPVRGWTKVLFELAAVQIVQHVQLNLFQVKLQGGPSRIQQAPVKPGLPLIHMGSCRAGETILHVPLLAAKIHLRLCRVCRRVWVWVHLGPIWESVCCCSCCVWKNRSVWVAAARRGEVSRGVRVSGHARVRWLLVLEQVGEVVGHHEARAAELWERSGGICTRRPGALLQLLPPAGPVLVVGIIDGVLDPQTLGLLHVWTLLSQRHGLPGFSCRNKIGLMICMLIGLTKLTNGC